MYSEGYDKLWQGQPASLSAARTYLCGNWAVWDNLYASSQLRFGIQFYKRVHASTCRNYIADYTE